MSSTKSERKNRTALDRLVSHRQISRVLKDLAPMRNKPGKGFRIKRKTVEVLRTGIMKCAEQLVSEIESIKGAETTDVAFHLPRHVPDRFVFRDDFDDAQLPTDAHVVAQSLEASPTE
jgi:hypothetical protein